MKRRRAAETLEFESAINNLKRPCFSKDLIGTKQSQSNKVEVQGMSPALDEETKGFYS